MGERDGICGATRHQEEVMMGAFGLPDTVNTITITTTSTAAASTSLKKHKWYRFCATQDVYVRIAALGDATSSSMFMKAGVPEIFYMGEQTRVSALRVSADGVLYMTPIITDEKET